VWQRSPTVLAGSRCGHWLELGRGVSSCCRSLAGAAMAEGKCARPAAGEEREKGHRGLAYARLKASGGGGGLEGNMPCSKRRRGPTCGTMQALAARGRGRRGKRNRGTCRPQRADWARWWWLLLWAQPNKNSNFSYLFKFSKLI
jgi:hypothetical protein